MLIVSYCKALLNCMRYVKDYSEQGWVHATWDHIDPTLQAIWGWNTKCSGSRRGSCCMDNYVEQLVFIWKLLCIPYTHNQRVSKISMQGWCGCNTLSESCIMAHHKYAKSLCHAIPTSFYIKKDVLITRFDVDEIVMKIVWILAENVLNTVWNEVFLSECLGYIVFVLT